MPALGVFPFLYLLLGFFTVLLNQKPQEQVILPALGVFHCRRLLLRFSWCCSIKAPQKQWLDWLLMSRAVLLQRSEPSVTPNKANEAVRGAITIAGTHYCNGGKGHGEQNTFNSHRLSFRSFRHFKNLWWATVILANSVGHGHFQFFVARHSHFKTFGGTRSFHGLLGGPQSF